jgi:Pyridoxamine 5'-phosphate oxidase
MLDAQEVADWWPHAATLRDAARDSDLVGRNALGRAGVPECPRAVEAQASGRGALVTVRAMRWAEVESQQSELAAVGLEKLGSPGVVLVGTVRRDGSPRITPVEPFFWDGELWLMMGLDSWKAKDLMRDPRVLVHSIVTSPDGQAGEYKIRGRAVLEEGEPVNESVAAAVAKQKDYTPVPGKFHLFRVDVGEITFVRWGRDNDQYLTRWPPGVEQLRRGTSATSNASPEPYSELLVQD